MGTSRDAASPLRDSGALQSPGWTLGRVEIDPVRPVARIGSYEIPLVPESRRMVIAYPGAPFPTFSFAALAEGREDATALRGRIVLVVHTASEHDWYEVPRTASGGPGRLPGGLIHAAALDTVLGSHHVHRVGGLAGWLLGCGLLAASLGVLSRLPYARALAVVAALAAAYGGAAFYLLAVQRVWLDLVLPLGSVGVAVFGALLYENQRVREVFGRFVPRSEVERLLGSGSRSEERVVTVLFADLRGFTTLSESRSPEEMRAMLERFHAAMGECYRRHGGYVCSYQGDAQMVVFGAPQPDPGHAAAAVGAAVAMRARMVLLNEELGTDLRFGIGICTGPASIGFIGNRDKSEYAALGDTTNTAARLQGKARDVGVDILVSGSTAAACGVELVPMPPVSLKGKAEPEPVFTLPPPAEERRPS